MAKNVFQDMVKTKRARTGVKPSTLATERTERLERVQEVRRIAERLPPEETVRPVKGNSDRRYGLWVVAGISILFFLFALSFFFAHASVLVTPKSVEVTFNENLSANKDSSISDGLSFDLVVISGEETKTIPATEAKDTS